MTAEPAKTRMQVVNQCHVVAKLARQIASVHDQLARTYGVILMDEGLIDVVGRDTATFMEVLGDLLNSMDAVALEDDWTNEVFAVAQATWKAQQ